MQEIVKNTIEKIEKDYKIDGLYKLGKDENIFCIQINSIVNICLSELGYTGIVSNNLDKLIGS